MMQQYRGGSLPNVNQMVNANSGIDLQVKHPLNAILASNHAKISHIEMLVLFDKS